MTAFENNRLVYDSELTQKQFLKLSGIISNEYGIKMPLSKKQLLQSRLYNRLLALEMKNFNEYFEFLFDHGVNESELIQLVDLVSTNKTGFFREMHHFEFIKGQILHETESGSFSNRLIKCWSAGCSSGEEPYSLSVTLQEIIEKNRSMDYKVMGTDISSRMINKAVQGIYKEEDTANIPYFQKKKYFLKSKDHSKNLVRLKPVIRNKNKFVRLNLMDERYPMMETFDYILCRNVLIYFEREVQEEVIKKLSARLKKGGYFFLGHSESIINMNVPLRQVRATIFQRI